MTDIQPVPLHEAARERYLNYAMSVITSRALPDVRDGLKPVQRRILYTMFHELALHPSSRYRKSAAVVGEVMGKYHPHGDQSIYDALVRMAQPFSLLHTLVDPQGNFGSLDGDPPAAMRYTECRLTAIAEELLQEIRKSTVDDRPTYDGQRDEPVVLPAQFPQLLVNGCEGIAVGLATRIPPHNLGEVIDACVALIDGSASTVEDLMAHVRGPDFPTGGRLLNDRADLTKIYSEGAGSLRVQAEWTVETEARRSRIVITSVPYATNKAKIVERIGAAVEERKLPQVVDVRDESTEDVRVVLDLRAGATAEPVMAWLFKYTPLESTFPVQLNALLPSGLLDDDDFSDADVVPGEVPVPRRFDLPTMLRAWLQFRYQTVYRRFQHDLRELERRIHLLEGFAICYANLDEVIAIIRASEGKRDAADKLMQRFPLDEVQTDAILELMLYKIARLEIQIILDELEEKRAEAARIRELLASEARMWEQVRHELMALRQAYARPRMTQIGAAGPALTYDERDYEVSEETFLVVTRDGWVKRQSSFSEVGKIRVRDQDEVGWLYRAETTSTVTFVMTDGVAYTCKIGDIPNTSGHGHPLSRQFSLHDGARVVGVIAHGDDLDALPRGPVGEDDAPGPYLVGVTRQGRIQRLVLAPYAEVSTRAGRRFARVDEGDALVLAEAAGGAERVCVASRGGNALVFPLVEASLLKGAGKGMTAIHLKGDDEVIQAALATGKQDGFRVTLITAKETREAEISEAALGLGARAAAGRSLFRKGELKPLKREPCVRATKAETPDAPAGGEA
jgi:DNA gyrase subunit A